MSQNIIPCQSILGMDEIDTIQNLANRNLEIKNAHNIKGPIMISAPCINGHRAISITGK